MKKLIKGMSVLFFALLIVCAFNVNAKAADHTTLPLDGNWKESTVGDNSDFYNLIVPSDGYVKLTLQTKSIKVVYAAITPLDGDGNYLQICATGGGEKSPGTESGEILLTKGKYLVEVWAGNFNSGSYKIKAIHTPVNITEKESNDDWDTAMTLPMNNEIKGMIPNSPNESYDVDFYKIKIDKNTNFRLTLISNFYDCEMVFYNADKEKASRVCIDTYAFDGHQGTAYINVNSAPAGTYYVKIEGSKSGTYSLRMKEIIKASSVKITGAKSSIQVGSKLNLKAIVGPENVEDKSVTWKLEKLSENFYACAKLSDKGVLTTLTPGIVRITATTCDGSKKSASVIVKIVDKKVSGLKLKNIKKNKMVIAWKATNHALKYQIQYSTNKNFKNAKVKTVSLHHDIYTLSKLKRGKTYYVRVRSVSYGKTLAPWSKTAKIKIKK